MEGKDYDLNDPNDVRRMLLDVEEENLRAIFGENWNKDTDEGLSELTILMEEKEWSEICSSY